MSKAWPVRGIDPRASVRRNARRILRVRIDELFSYAPVIPDPERVADLHAARIAAKRLRYTLELFDMIFGKRGAAAIDQLKDIQDLLGQIHDADVRIRLIEAESGSPHLDARVRTGLATMAMQELAVRSQMHQDVVQHWNALSDAGFERSLRLLTKR